MQCMFCNHRVATYLLIRLGGVTRGMRVIMEKDGSDWLDFQLAQS